MRYLPPLPIPVKSVLRKLGQDLRKARLRRHITMDLVAKRASISRTTLSKIEKGDPSVSFGIYASVIFVLGLLPHLAALLDPNEDQLGRSLEDEDLPQRVRFPIVPRLKRVDNG